MLDKDGAEDFVDDIVDDLIDLTLGRCYELHIQRQLIPFTVSQAKDAILSIIEVSVSHSILQSLSFSSVLFTDADNELPLLKFVTDICLVLIFIYMY